VIRRSLKCPYAGGDAGQRILAQSDPCHLICLCQGFGDKDNVLKSKSNLIKGVWKRLQGETSMNSVTPRTVSSQPAEAAQRQDAPDGGVFSRSTTVPQGIYQTVRFPLPRPTAPGLGKSRPP